MPARLLETMLASAESVEGGGKEPRTYVFT